MTPAFVVSLGVSTCGIVEACRLVLAFVNVYITVTTFVPSAVAVAFVIQVQVFAGAIVSTRIRFTFIRLFLTFFTFITNQTLTFIMKDIKA
jgi:hypothetical protein